VNFDDSDDVDVPDVAATQDQQSHEVPDSKGLAGLHPDIIAKCSRLYKPGTYAVAVEKSFKIVRDRLRKLTGFERGGDAFGNTQLHIKGAAAPHVGHDFNEGSKFLMMAIDMFRNEKSHTADAHIDDPDRARLYLAVSSLALSLLDQAEIGGRPPNPERVRKADAGKVVAEKGRVASPSMSTRK
jgi:uncharacterized protein (TIGR02391 family)